MRLVTTLVVVLLVSSACGGGPGDTGGTGDDGQPTPGTATGPVGDWVLVDADPTIDLPDGSRATLQVAEDGSAGGDTPCNSFGGRVTWTSEGRFGIDEVAVTEMGCEPDRTAAQETYLDLLLAATSWSTPTEDRLLLEGDAGTLTLYRVAPVDAAGLVGTDWVVTGFLDGDAVTSMAWDARDARLRLDGDETGGTLTMFSGCRSFTGEWVADGDRIALPSFGQAADSRDVDACSEAELESEELVLAAVEGGFTTVVDGRSLELRSASDAEIGLMLRVDVEDG